MSPSSFVTILLHSQVGILEHWDLSMDLFNARVKSPVRDWKVEVCACIIPGERETLEEVETRYCILICTIVCLSFEVPL